MSADVGSIEGVGWIGYIIVGLVAIILIGLWMWIKKLVGLPI